MRKWLERHLGRQLSNPQGFWGMIVGKLMNFNNKLMYQSAHEMLELTSNENLLEIGFGNGAFIKDIIHKIEPGHYSGIDISDTMIKQAKQKNKSLINSGKVYLFKSNANSLPFDNDAFDKVLTINTIYFWDEPMRVMEEVKRVLQPGGKFVVALNTKGAMEGSEYVKEKFNLYDKEQVEYLFRNSGFTLIRSTYKKMNIDDVLCIEGRKEN
ncbi:class I SAM-dependent methyltransferase [Flavobacterium sp. ZT3R18]|uniref:class I SAM-dependent methyltransferase n=1 Tax=Flavobacterium sp. ZT3R18 TaxID=2594429 RepID=UPI001179AEAA|nr:class I SAM-dependent methyltransferase [Flavobacterium sp. ZT3R18]TRX33001.1 class I SAM-dependent methyltransferase [Flavobacterium sp. ZT3R18]